MSTRPKWANAVRIFINDEVMNKKYEFPMDGSDDDLLDEIDAAVNAILCKRYGHEIVDDQCMIPEHRYCVYCARGETQL